MASLMMLPAGTHYPIALYAIERKLHVLVTKPATQLLQHHQDLIVKAKEYNVIVFVEHHKRSFSPLPMRRANY